LLSAGVFPESIHHNLGGSPGSICATVGIGLNGLTSTNRVAAPETTSGIPSRLAETTVSIRSYFPASTVIVANGSLSANNLPADANKNKMNMELIRIDLRLSIFNSPAY